MWAILQTVFETASSAWERCRRPGRPANLSPHPRSRESLTNAQTHLKLLDSLEAGPSERESWGKWLTHKMPNKWNAFLSLVYMGRFVGETMFFFEQFFAAWYENDPEEFEAAMKQAEYWVYLIGLVDLVAGLWRGDGRSTNPINEVFERSGSAALFILFRFDLGLPAFFAWEGAMLTNMFVDPDLSLKEQLQIALNLGNRIGIASQGLHSESKQSGSFKKAWRLTSRVNHMLTHAILKYAIWNRVGSYLTFPPLFGDVVGLMAAITSVGCSLAELNFGNSPTTADLERNLLQKTVGVIQALSQASITLPQCIGMMAHTPRAMAMLLGSIGVEVDWQPSFDLLDSDLPSTYILWSVTAFAMWAVYQDTQAKNKESFLTAARQMLVVSRPPDLLLPESKEFVRQGGGSLLRHRLFGGSGEDRLGSSHSHLADEESQLPENLPQARSAFQALEIERPAERLRQRENPIYKCWALLVSPAVTSARQEESSAASSCVKRC